jgi:hypothetical protein
MAEGGDDPPRAGEVLDALADEWLLGRAQVYTRLEPRGSVLPPRPPPPRVHVEPQTWGIFPERLRLEREYERSPMIVDDLTQQVPQALLRDLHRPDLDVHRARLVELLEPRDVAGQRALRALRDEVSARLRPPVLGSSHAEVRAHQAYMHALRTEPWRAYLDDDAPRANELAAAEQAAQAAEDADDDW